MKKLILIVGALLFSNNLFSNGKLCEKLYDVLQACPDSERGSYINAACPQFAGKVRDWHQVNRDITGWPEKSKQIQKQIEDIKDQISKINKNTGEGADRIKMFERNLEQLGGELRNVPILLAQLNSKKMALENEFKGIDARACNCYNC